jgi:hypothetical protein
VKVTFVSLGQEQLAIGSLSAVLRREGHDAALVFNPALFDDDGFLDQPGVARRLDQTDRVIDEIVASEPDLVAFSVLSAAYRWSVDVDGSGTDVVRPRRPPWLS